MPKVFVCAERRIKQLVKADLYNKRILRANFSQQRIQKVDVKR